MENVTSTAEKEAQARYAASHAAALPFVPEYINGFRYELSEREIKGKIWFLAKEFLKLKVSFKQASEGRRTEKQTAFYRFPTVERRAVWLEMRSREVLTRAAAQEARNTARKAALVSFEQPFKVGDVLYQSWGYDQTNIDFYQVVALGKKSVKVQELCQEVTETGFMCGDTTPLWGQFKKNSKPETKLVKVYASSVGKFSYAVCNGRHSLTKMDRGSIGCSWYA